MKDVGMGELVCKWLWWPQWVSIALIYRLHTLTWLSIPQSFHKAAAEKASMSVSTSVHERSVPLLSKSFWTAVQLRKIIILAENSWANPLTDHTSSAQYRQVKPAQGSQWYKAWYHKWCNGSVRQGNRELRVLSCGAWVTKGFTLVLYGTLVS